MNNESMLLEINSLQSDGPILNHPLIPTDIDQDLKNFFLHFMGNKLHVGRILLYGQPELRDVAPEIAEKSTNQFKKLEGQFVFFRQTIKEALINKFNQIVSFSNIFSENFDLLKQDISSLLEDDKSQLYKVPLEEYRQVVQNYKKVKMAAGEKELVTILQETKTALEGIFQEFSDIQNEVSKIKEQKALNDLKGKLEPIETKLDEIDREILTSTVNNDLKLLTLTQSSSSNKFGISWRDASPHSILLGQYNKLLEDLKQYPKLENIFIFNSLLESWIKKINNLMASLKKIDEVWSNINNNLQEIEEFIDDNEKNAVNVNKILDHLAVAKDTLEQQSAMARKFEYKSTVKVPFAISEDKYLDLVFLFKETNIYQ